MTLRRLALLLLLCGAIVACRRAPSDPKLLVIEATDRALRARDAQALLALIVPADGTAARGADSLEAVRKCLAAADWSKARPLALNYGGRRGGDGGLLKALGSRAELYYGLEARVWKVTVHPVYPPGRGGALGRAPACVEKREDARTVEADLVRLANCRIGPWPAVTKLRPGLRCD